MPAQNGQGTTYNLDSYRGELFEATPVETPIFSAIGGLTGQGSNVASTEFEWQGYDLRNVGDRAVREGQAAGEGVLRKKYNVTNVIQSHQESFEISDVRQAAVANFAGVNNNQSDPSADEISFQTEAKLAEIARDIEWAIVNQTKNVPVDNTQARKTRGLREAITTNVIANGTAKDLSEDMIRALLKGIRGSGGARRTDRVTFVADAEQVLRLNDIFLGKGTSGKAPESRTVGGVNLQTVVTPFGQFNVLMHDFVPAGELLVVDLAELDIKVLPIPGKADVYVEKLARVGTMDRYQVATHWGLKYGNEKLHGKITGLNG